MEEMKMQQTQYLLKEGKLDLILPPLNPFGIIVNN